MDWGSKEWLETQLSPTSELGDQWGHKWRGGQKLRHTNILNILKKYLTPSQKFTILDIGCSHGDFTKLIDQNFTHSQIYGTDISQIPLDFAQRTIPQGRFEVASLPDIGHGHIKFDMILSLEVLYYLSSSDREMSLKNINDRLDHNGHYIFSAVINKGEQYFSENSAKELIQKYFTIEDCYFAHARLYSIIEKPLNKIVKINLKLQQNIGDKNTFTGKKQKVWNFIVKIKLDYPVKYFIQAMSFFAKKLISSVTFAAFCEKISQKLFKNWSKSSIIIVARKS